MKRWSAIALVGGMLATCEAAHAGGPPRPASPMTQLARSNDALWACLRREYPSWSPEADLQRSTLRRLLGNSMDYGEIGRRALGARWDRLSVADRAEFVDDLGKVIESRYLRLQMYPASEFEVRFDRETVSDGGTASVFGTVMDRSRRKPVRVAIEYRLLWKGDHWVLYDVVTDDESMLESYRYQFDRIISRESFGGLLRRLRQQAEISPDRR